MTTDIDLSASPVAGVDTHTDTHTVAAVTPTGRHLATETFPTTRPGYTHLAEFLCKHGVGAVGVEGTNSFGAGLTRHLIDRGYTVVEVLRPARSIRRRDGKSDPVDALAAARQVLTGEGLSTPQRFHGPGGVVTSVTDHPETAGVHHRETHHNDEVVAGRNRALPPAGRGHE